MEKIKQYLIPAAAVLLIFGLLLSVGSIIGFSNLGNDKIKESNDGEAFSLSDFRIRRDYSKALLVTSTSSGISSGRNAQEITEAENRLVEMGILGFTGDLSYNAVALLMFGIFDILAGVGILIASKKYA